MIPLENTKCIIYHGYILFIMHYDMSILSLIFLLDLHYLPTTSRKIASINIVFLSLPISCYQTKRMFATYVMAFRLKKRIVATIQFFLTKQKNGILIAYNTRSNNCYELHLFDVVMITIEHLVGAKKKTTHSSQFSGAERVIIF